LFVQNEGARIVQRHLALRARSGCSGPLLRVVQDTIDFDEIIADAINGQEGKARKNKLAGAWAAA
jgi:hypothetical protein